MDGTLLLAFIWCGWVFTAFFWFLQMVARPLFESMMETARERLAEANLKKANG